MTYEASGVDDKQRSPKAGELPAYYRGARAEHDQLGSHAESAARQILATTRVYLSRPTEELCVLDIGSGYGHTAAALAKRCRRVVGIEPSRTLCEFAVANYASDAASNLEFRCQSATDVDGAETFDLALLDNVLEHVPNQAEMLDRIATALKPGGVLYLLVPNKLWPIEVHYRLPFLSYLPLPLANLYLRTTGRGQDYADASYAPTYFGLQRLLRDCGQFTFEFVLPADVRLAAGGGSWLYRAGVAAIGRCRWLWIISKALLVVAVKQSPEVTAEPA